MRLIYSLILLFFLFSGISQSNETIKFIDINYILNNSDAGKSLNKIIERNISMLIDSNMKILLKLLLIIFTGKKNYFYFTFIIF